MAVITFSVVNDKRPMGFNIKESEILDLLRDILIRSRDDTTFVVDNDVTLEFLQEFRPHSAEFDDDQYPPSREEILEILQFEEEEEECVPQGEVIVSLEYKEKVVAFWKNEKSDAHM